MAATSTVYSGNGVTTDFAIGFTYTSRNFVKVYVGGVLVGTPGTYTFLNSTTIRFGVAPVSGTNNIEIRRTTSTTPIVDFVGAATITDTDLDLAIDQCLDLLEENQNNSIVGMQQTGGNWDATSDRLINLATPLASTDGANKAYVDSVVGSASAAAASAAAAASSAGDALTYAGDANTYKGQAQTYATNAANSAASIASAIPISGLTANEVPVATGATTYDAIPIQLNKWISSPSGSAVSQIDIALTGGYSEYLLELYDFYPTTDADHLLLRFSLDSGSTYVSTGDYKYVLSQPNVGGSRNNDSNAGTSIRVAGNLDNTRRSTCLSIRIFPADGSSTFNSVLASGLVQDSAAANAVGVVTSGGDLESANTRATHVRLLPSTGASTITVTSGRLYGVVR